MTELIATRLRDKLAIFLSALCVAQCLMLPFVVTILPFLDIWWLSDSFLHPFLLLFVVPLTFYTLIPAKRRHGSMVPITIALPGLAFLSVGAFMHATSLEKIFTVIGASLLAAAHIQNILLSRKLVAATR